MQAYSLDLRVRIINAYLDHKDSPAKLAERFMVSERWLRRLIHQYRTTGVLAPRPHGGGRPRLFGPDQEHRLCQVLAETPDASLDELRQRCEVQSSRMAVARTLARLGITRKKSRCGTPNNKIRTCNASGKPGAARPATLNQPAFRFSIKPKPKPP
jgi:transposase